MKKFFLFPIVIFITATSIAQVREYFPSGYRQAHIPQELKNLHVLKNERFTIPSTPSAASQRLALPSKHVQTLSVIEEKIGETYYDLQWNNAVSNRVSNNGDGTFSACWMTSPDTVLVPVAFPSRGTGYNYYDGTAWGPVSNSSITIERSGHPSLAVSSNGAEVLIQHTSSGMSLGHRAVKGTGPFIFSYPWGMNDATWPKLAVSGNTLHAVWHGSGNSGTPVGGQDGPIFYSNSNDAGVTWSTPVIPADIDSSNYLGFGSDNYMIAAEGNTVILVFGSVVTDLGYLKSTDGGTTWTKHIVLTHPIPMYDVQTQSTDTNNNGIPDTLTTCSGDAFGLIDNDGMVHIWFSEIRWYSDLSVPGSYNYFPLTDGLMYWNESMPVDGYVKIATAEDFNGNGMLDLATGCYSLEEKITSMPSAGIDPNGTIYLTYQTINEAADTSVYNKSRQHIYMKALPKTGGVYLPQNYSPAYNIIPSIAQGGNGEFQEGVYASVAKRADASYAYVVYQRDSVPGISQGLAGVCSVQNNFGVLNDIIFAKVDVSVFLTSIPQEKFNENSFMVYPNPATHSVNIEVKTNIFNDAVIEITDAVGHIMYKQKIRDNVGRIKIDTGKWNRGIYIVNVMAENTTSVKKLVIH